MNWVGRHSILAVVSPISFHDSKCNVYKYSFVSDCTIVKKEGRQRGYAKHNFIRFEDLTFPNPYEYASFVLENLVSYSLKTWMKYSTSSLISSYKCKCKKGKCAETKNINCDFGLGNSARACYTLRW